jgi:cycloartenol synthase
MKNGMEEEENKVIKINTILLFFSLKVTMNRSGNTSCWYRHISKGGWNFSTQENGWPVSDCTAEGLKVTNYI